GRNLVYVATRDDSEQLFLRPLDKLEPAPIPGTQHARNPFFSADGEWVGFVADRALKKVSLRGGSPITLVTPIDEDLGCAGSDEVICPRSYVDGLARVGAAGGAPRELTKVDATKREFGHWFPQLLPDGEHVLFTIWRTRLRDAQLAVVSLASGERRIVH